MGFGCYAVSETVLLATATARSVRLSDGRDVSKGAVLDNDRNSHFCCDRQNVPLIANLAVSLKNKNKQLCF